MEIWAVDLVRVLHEGMRLDGVYSLLSQRVISRAFSVASRWHSNESRYRLFFNIEEHRLIRIGDR